MCIRLSLSVFLIAVMAWPALADPCDSLPMLDIQLEGPRCVDSILAFSVEEAGLADYEWSFSDGEVSTEERPMRTFGEPGPFTVLLMAVDSNGCERSGSLALEIAECSPPDPCADAPPLQIVADTLVCLDSTAHFRLEGPDRLQVYDWNFGAGQRSDEAAPMVDYDTAGQYAVIVLAVDSAGCIYSANFSFEVAFCEPEGGCGYVFPNTFTPNADGVNDTFGLLYNCPVESFGLRIFDRWGNQVFQTEDLEQGWDGNYKSRPAPSEVYFFVAVVTTAQGETLNLKGDLTLVR